MTRTAEELNLKQIEEIFSRTICWYIKTSCVRCNNAFGAYMIYYDNGKEYIRMCSFCKKEWEKTLGVES
jgi:hypothetical protein